MQDRRDVIQDTCRKERMLDRTDASKGERTDAGQLTMDIHCKGSWTGEDAGQEWRKELQGGGSPYER